MTALVFFYPFSFGASASREIMAVSVTGNRYGHRWLLLCNTNVFLSAGHNGLIQRCCRRDVRRTVWLDREQSGNQAYGSFAVFYYTISELE